MNNTYITKEGQHPFSRCGLTHISAATAGFSFTLCFFLPVHIFLINQREFYTPTAILVFLFLALSSSIFLLLTGVVFALGVRTRRLAVSICTFLGLAVWIQAYVFNWNYGPLDGSYWVFRFFDVRAMDSFVWLFLAMFVFVFGVLKGYSFRTPLVIILVIQGGSVLHTLHTTHGIETDEEIAGISRQNQFTFSSDDNIIMLVLDAFQTDVFNAYLESNPEYKATLPGFTYYPDTLATAYLTARSLPVMLTGQVYDGQTAFAEYLTEANNNHLIHRHLRQAGYYVGVYNFFAGARGYYHPAAFRGIANNYTEKSASIDHYTQHEFSRIMAVAFFRAAPHLAKQDIYNRWVLDLSVEQDRDIFSRELRRQGRADTSQPRFNYYHLQGLHQPHVANGTYLNWENPESSVHIAAYLCDMLAAFVNTLQELEVYDSAAILIVGDHGLLWNPDDIRYGNFYAPHIQTAAPLGAFAKKLRALPLLLFKPPSASGPLQISDRAVSLVDVVPTLMDVADNYDEQTREAYEGQSLLQTQTKPRIRRFFSSEYLRQPFYEYAVSGFSWYDTSWTYTGNVYYDGHIEREVLYNYSPGNMLSFGKAGTGMQYLDGRWEAQEHSHVMKGSEASLTLPLESYSDSMLLIMDVSVFPENNIVESLTVQLWINDTIAGQYILDDKTRIKIDVTDEMIPAGKKPKDAPPTPATLWLTPVPQPSDTRMTIRFEGAGNTMPHANDPDDTQGRTLALHTLTLCEH